ncbi:MAG: sigma-70 family RNA polymerase sigma factor [Polyangiaceae bacterium]|nr:sigma-70 family RNA polymerase sigma factor [Polyangiaceae bacterium]
MSPRLNPSNETPLTFEDLYAEHAPRVQSLLWLLGVPPAEREDVAQEVWSEVYRSLVLFTPRRGSPRAWIAGIARNAAREWKRTQRRRPEFSTSTNVEPISEKTAETAFIGAQRIAALWRILERTVPNPEQREAFVLFAIHGLTVDEVASATGTHPLTAKWRIAMARRRFKQEMSEEERRTFAAILPVLSVDEFVKAASETHVSEDEVARVWERVTAQIEAEGGSIHDPLGGTAPPVTSNPPVYNFSGRTIAATLTGTFLAGALAGAIAYSFALEPRVIVASTTIDAEPQPKSIPTAAPTPEPSPTASVHAVPETRPAPRPSDEWLLERARKVGPEEALQLVERHSRLYPKSARAATREELAVYALLQLGRRNEAKQRAVALVRTSPKKRVAMENLFGESIF